MEEMRNTYQIFVGIPIVKRPLGRPRCRWKNNIRTDFGETGREVVDCIYLALDRDQWRAVFNKVMNLWVP
jgi:hypothetical protein